MANSTYSFELEFIPKLMNVEEVAGILKLSKSAVYKMLKNEEIPCLRFGRAVRVRLVDLQSFLDAQVQ